MTYVNMLGPFVLTWVFGNVNCTCVITEYGNAPCVNTKVLELLSYPQQLSTTRGSCHIFGFCCGHGNGVLFLGCPRYQTASKKASHTWGAFPIN